MGRKVRFLPTGGRTWVVRIVIGDKRRDIRLGGYPGVTLSEASDAALVARAKVKQGIDPIEEARANQSALRASLAAAVSFEDCTGRHIEAHAASWKNAKSSEQWRNTLDT